MTTHARNASVLVSQAPRTSQVFGRCDAGNRVGPQYLCAQNKGTYTASIFAGLSRETLQYLWDRCEVCDENEEHLHEDHKELLQGKRGSVHKRPKVAATNPGGLKGLLTHGNTRDAGMAIYPSLEDASYTHLTGPQKVAKRAQRRSSRGSVVSY